MNPKFLPEDDKLSNSNPHGHVPGLTTVPAEQENLSGPSLRRAHPLVPSRNRHGLRKFIVFIVLVTLTMGMGYAIYIASIVANISTNSWQFGTISSDASGRTNVLVLGVGDPGHAGEGLSDTLMILSFDSASHRIAQISIPRDLRVPIEGYGYAKINAAHAYGGVELSEKTISNILGVPIDYYVKTDFSGLKGIVDAVGGIDVMVKQRLADPEYPCDDNQYKSCGLVIDAGLQHMDGSRVLAYVRCRKGTCGDDFGRASRQQQVLEILKPKLSDTTLLLHPARLQVLASATQKSIKTDLGIIQLLGIANSWRAQRDKAPINLVLSTSKGGYLRPDPTGSSDLLPIGGDFSLISERVKTLFVDPPTQD